MTNNQAADAPPPGPSGDRGQPGETGFRGAWHKIRNRLLEGLLVVLPILVTVWVVRWLYVTLDQVVIEPLAVLIIWKGQQLQGTPELPSWFENYVAPVIAVLIVVGFLYCCGVIAHTWFRRRFDQFMLRVPVVSKVYDGVRNVLQCFEKPKGQPAPQRVVLVGFPHPGMRVPAIVTSTCRDIATTRKLLCVYVPTTPIPTSGYFLIVPEDDVMELNWDIQQTLQAIISGGLTAPPEVTFFQKTLPSAVPTDRSPAAGQPPS